MPEPFVFDRSWRFPVSTETLWETVSRTDDFTDWWSWLRECDADGMAIGSVARCVIQAPLPYRLRLRISIDALEPGRLVATTVGGDLEGPARLEIASDGDGSFARLSWKLHLADTVLRRLALVAHPAMRWAHDRVVESGVRQFERNAL